MCYGSQGKRKYQEKWWPKALSDSEKSIIKEDQNEAIDNFCKKFPLSCRNTILTAEVEKEY